jgi:hypothetical protein
MKNVEGQIVTLDKLPKEDAKLKPGMFIVDSRCCVHVIKKIEYQRWLHTTKGLIFEINTK